MQKPTTNAPELQIPLFGTRVACGFQSPATDWIEKTIDLNLLCVQHPAATFYVRASGHSMTGVGIHDGDLLVVDRSLTPRNDDTVLAAYDGEFTVKVFQTLPRPALVPANPSYQPIYLDEASDMQIFGVVTYSLHQTRQP